MSVYADSYAPGSPTDTEPDKATWDFWPQAPLDDFARLIPVSPDARLGFQAVVERRLASPQKEPWPYSARFIHWERTQFDDSESQVTLESTPETGLSSDAEHTQIQSQTAHLPQIYTGYYRLNMVDPPEGCVWIVGVGRKSRNVELIITTPERKSEDGVFGRHAKLKRSFDSGAIIVATDSHPITVDGHPLVRRRDQNEEPAMYQRVAGNKSLISLGRMTYELQMQDLRPDVDRAQMEAARKSVACIGPGPAFYLTPTPTMSGIVIGNYHVFEPFASGSVGTMHYVTHTVTGKPYALKRIRRRNDHDERAIQSEINILRSISHAHACRFVEVFTQRFDRPDIRQSNGFAEVCVVLDPAARRSLEEFVNPQFCEDVGPSLEVKAARELFIQNVVLQLADVGAYLHGKGVMHRDYKLENVAVVRTTPEVHVVLIDFGHAVEAVQSNDHMKGTVRYLAPEVLALKHDRSWSPYNCLVDVWALGVVVMELDLQRRVRSEDDAQQWAKELQQRKKDSESTPLQQLLPRFLRLDAKERIKMQQIVHELGQQFSSAGKRRATGGNETAGGRTKPFSRQIELKVPGFLGTCHVPGKTV